MAYQNLKAFLILGIRSLFLRVDIVSYDMVPYSQSEFKIYKFESP